MREITRELDSVAPAWLVDLKIWRRANQLRGVFMYPILFFFSAGKS